MSAAEKAESPSKILPLAPKDIKPGSHAGKVIAVFTSGGDSQGEPNDKNYPVFLPSTRNPAFRHDFEHDFCFTIKHAHFRVTWFQA